MNSPEHLWSVTDFMEPWRLRGKSYCSQLQNIYTMLHKFRARHHGDEGLSEDGQPLLGQDHLGGEEPHAPGGRELPGATGWRCQACTLEVREDQDHLASCSGYSDIRAGRDLTVESELVEFIKSVMARRKEMSWD